MKGLILAGGKGTRLRPLTVYTPKPIVPVVNRPFLLYQVEILRQAGVTDITLALSYQPDKIEDVLVDGSDHGVSLRFVTEPNPMGTGGAYRFASESTDETTIVLNGDILTDVDLDRVLSLHQRNQAAATITLVRVEDPSRYGLVETDAEGCVLRFLEKPKPEEAADLKVNTINAGVYVLEPTILEMIPEGENRSFEYNVFPAILERKMPFYGYVLSGEYWRDIGSPESYLAAHHDLLSGRLSGFDVDRSARSDIATVATVDNASVIGEGCVIKPQARIVNSVLGAGVHVEERAVVADSVVWAHTRISNFAEVHKAVIGKSCHIGRNVTVGEGSVLGDKTVLPDYSKV